MHSILDHVPTKLRWKAHTNGGEHAGPCPWCGGRDRFRVWPNSGDRGRFWCRQCGRSGDSITLLRDLKGISYEEACNEFGGIGFSPQRIPSPPAITSRKEALKPPPKIWRSRAWALTEESVSCLWTDAGLRARKWLKKTWPHRQNDALCLVGLQST